MTRLFVPTRLVKGQSKYIRHQGKRERIRRLRQLINGTRTSNPQDEWTPRLETQNQLLRLLT
jgi:hypothetical protein